MPIGVFVPSGPLYGFRRQWYTQEIFGYDSDGFYRLVRQDHFRQPNDPAMAPVNGRFIRRVNRLVTWREVLEANDYVIRHGRRVSSYEMSISRGAKVARVQRSGEERSDVFYIRCLYHDERSASLRLVPGGFHCFGCSASGTMVDFVATLNHLCSSRDIKDYFVYAFPQMTARPE